ncbi:MAG: LysR family transcriptional regulator [Burkholderiales bacterium]|nr:LysR family transcriptional regulator [Burkholderiales bacterium]
MTDDILPQTGQSRAASPGSLNLRQLEVFHAIMLTGSISAAGRILHVSQPAVSRVLSTIEMRLGFQLFERAGGRLHATRQARLLFREAEAIHAKVLEANQLLAHLAGGKGEVLYVATSPSFSQWIVPRVVSQFQRRHANVKIKYRPLSLDNLLPLLLSGQIEVAISSVPPDHPNIVCEPLRMGNLVCILPKGHRLAERTLIKADDLKDETIIGYGADTPLGRLAHPFWEVASCRCAIAVEVRSALTACNFVRGGNAVALVDSFVVSPSVVEEVIVRPIDPARPMNVYISHSKDESLSLSAIAFVRAFKSVLNKDYMALARSLRIDCGSPP